MLLIWFLVIKRNTQNCRNKFWISQQPLEKTISSALQITPQKTSNKSESEHHGLSEGPAVLRYLHTSPETQGRSGVTLTQAWHQSHQPIQKMPAHHLPWELAPQCDSASRFLKQWDTEENEVSCKSRGNPNGSNPCQNSFLRVTSQNYSLSLSLSAAVHHKEGSYSYWFQQIYTNST